MTAAGEESRIRPEQTLPDHPVPDDLLSVRDLSVLSCMTDLHQRMRLSWLFRLFQEVSIRHTIELGVDRSKTLDKGLLWVISRQSLTIHRMPSYDERIRLSTWPGKTLEILFPRYYRVDSITAGRPSPEQNLHAQTGYDGSSENVSPVLAEGEAFWLLMDREKRSFAFPRANGIAIPQSPLAPVEQPFPKPLRCPPEIELTSVHTYSAQYSQIDLNGHINNANYYDIIDDLQASDGTVRIPHHIEAEYRTEIRPGADVQIVCGSSPDESEWYCEGYLMGGGSVSESRHTPPMFRILMAYSDPFRES